MVYQLNCVIFEAKYILFKGKFAAQFGKSCRKTKGHERKTQIRSRRRCTVVRSRQHNHATPSIGRGKHHGQPMVVAVPCTPCFTSLLCRLLFLARGFCYSVPVSGHFGPLLAFFFDLLSLKNIFQYHAWHLQSRNLQKSLKTSKTTHNRKNRGVRNTLYINIELKYRH